MDLAAAISIATAEPISPFWLCRRTRSRPISGRASTSRRRSYSKPPPVFGPIAIGDLNATGARIF
jgi:hypothetical protein